MVISKAVTRTQPSNPKPIIQATIDPMPPSIIIPIGQRWARAVPLLAMLWTLPVWAEPGSFSVSGLGGWKEQTFKGRKATQYRLAQDSGVQVLEADCRASASGWIWKEKIDLRHTPVLRWRWKVAQIYSGVREREKGGDDFPARVYVVLDGGWAVWRSRSLVYVWASAEPQGTDWASGYTGQAHLIALRSGAAAAARWQEERRDVRADFQRYFGLDVDAVDGVAVMTDCDDAGGAMRAWYGDLRFEKAVR